MDDQTVRYAHQEAGTMTISRRNLLKKGAAATVAGGAALVGGGSAAGQTATGSGGSSPNLAGRKFRALVTTGFGANTTSLMDLTLLPIGGRQVVVKTEVSQ